MLTPGNSGARSPSGGASKSPKGPFLVYFNLHFTLIFEHVRSIFNLVYWIKKIRQIDENQIRPSWDYVSRGPEPLWKGGKCQSNDYDKFLILLKGQNFRSSVNFEQKEKVETKPKKQVWTTFTAKKKKPIIYDCEYLIGLGIVEMGKVGICPPSF